MTTSRFTRLLLSLLLPLALIGCAGTPDRESGGAYFEDGWITTQVKSALLLDPGTSGMKINVQTANGVVLLSGFASASEAKRAVEVAKETRGVKSVKNEVVVRQ
jgi:osmotically-inducible protein OsmY